MWRKCRWTGRAFGVEAALGDRVPKVAAISGYAEQEIQKLSTFVSKSSPEKCANDPQR